MPTLLSASNQRRLVQGRERTIRSAFAFGADDEPGKFRRGQTMDEIVFHGERKMMDAADAVMVVIRRAAFIMVMMRFVRRGFFVIVAAAIQRLRVAASRVIGTGRAGGENTGIESGEDAENHEPCEKVPHVWFSSSFT